MIVSRPTPTTIKRDVPPIRYMPRIPLTQANRYGSTAIPARKTAPTSSPNTSAARLEMWVAAGPTMAERERAAAGFERRGRLERYRLVADEFFVPRRDQGNS